MTILDRFREAVSDLKRIVTPGWGYDDVSVEGYNPIHVINNVWQRVIALVSGYDYASKRRRFISVDEYGRVGVTFTGAGGVTANIEQYSVNTTPTLIKSANPDRTFIHVKNIGSFMVYISNNNAVSPTTGYPIGVNEAIVIENYKSDLWAVSVSYLSVIAVIEA